MSDYTIHIKTEETCTVYAIVTRDGREARQLAYFAPGQNTVDNALLVALSDLLSRINKPKDITSLSLNKILDYDSQAAKKYTVSIPLFEDDIIGELVGLFGGAELRIE